MDLTIAPAARELAWLSRFEVERAARFRAPRDRARYLAAHVALRLLVQQASGIAAATQLYTRGARGKWRLVDRPTWHFNLSYAGDTALIGIARHHEIGVDIEAERPIEDADALAALHFNRRERAALRARAADRDAAFLHGWTRKEACLKAIGMGLGLPPIALDTGLSGDRRVIHGSTRIEVGSFRRDNLIAAWARLVPGDQ